MTFKGKWRHNSKQAQQNIDVSGQLLPWPLYHQAIHLLSDDRRASGPNSWSGFCGEEKELCPC